MIKKYFSKIALIFVLCTILFGGIVFFDSKTIYAQIEPNEYLQETQYQLGEEENNLSLQPISYQTDFGNNHNHVNSSLFSNSQTTTIINNVIGFKFQNDAKDLSNSIDFPVKDGNTLTDIMQSALNGDNSLRDYYLKESNGKLIINTDILTTNSSDEMYMQTVPYNREVFMPYYSVMEIDELYEINNQGYFDYELVTNTSPLVNTNQYTQILTMPVESHVCNVYDCTKDKSAHKQCDDDPSDGVMCYCKAYAYAQTHNCNLIESFDQYTRNIYLVYYLLNSLRNELINANQNILETEEQQIDSVVFYQNPSSYYLQWSDLLWPHQVNMGSNLETIKDELSPALTTVNEDFIMDRFCQYGGNRNLYQYTLDTITDTPSYTSNNLSLGKYNLVTFEFSPTQIDGNHEIIDTGENYYDYACRAYSTAAHEMGHTLGLEDLYNYTNNSSVTVGEWSRMSYQTSPHPQYTTSYEREKLNYLDTTHNIQTLVYNGTYTLNAVKGDDEDNVVCYRLPEVTVSGKTEQIYIEYRSKNVANSYDALLPESGLLIYRVNKDVAGNKRTTGTALNPHEIYILRNSGDSEDNCALGTIGESMSSSITYSSGASAGTSIRIIAINDSFLTFTIQSNALQTKQVLSLADCRNNSAVYNYLKNLASGLGEDILYRDSLVPVTKLDFSGMNVNDISFLSKLSLPSLISVNFIDNNIEASQISALYNWAYTNNVSYVALIDNKINLTSLSNAYLSYSKFIYGLQNIDSLQSLNINSNPTVQVYWNSNYNTQFSYNETLNGKSESPIHTTSILTKTGTYRFNITGKSSGNFFGENTVVNLINCTITSKPTHTFERALTTYTPLGADFTIINGISGVTFESISPIDLSNTTNNGSFQIKVKYNNNLIITLTQNYIIQDTTKPIIKFYENNSEVLESEFAIFIGGTYTPLQYKIFDLAVEINKTATIKYYNATMSNDVIVKGSETTGINVSARAIFIVEYTFEDNYDNSETKQLIYRVVPNFILSTEFVDQNLYNKLLALGGESVLNEDAFVNTNYIDLTYSNIASLDGIEKLFLKDNVIINLSGNQLSDADELASLLEEKPNIKYLVLLFNNYVLETNSNTKLIFGLQNLVQNTKFVDIEDQAVNLSYNMVEDYSSVFTLSTNITTPMTFGNQTISFIGKGDLYGKTFTRNFIYGKIELVEKEVTIEVFDTYIPTTVTFLGLSSSSYNIVVDNVVTNTIGDFEVHYIVEDDNQVEFADLIQTLHIEDNENPTIRLNGNAIVHVKKGEAFGELGVIADDNYSSCTLSTSYKYKENEDDEYEDVVEINTDNTGYYEITYTAKDSSNNEMSITRTAIVGDVQILQPSVMDWDTNYTPSFTFTIFERSWFAISYRMQGTTTWNSITNSTPFINLKQYGEVNYDIRLTGVSGINLTYNFVLLAKVKDTTAPVMVLAGLPTIKVHYGVSYSDAGCVVTDNSTTERLTLTRVNNAPSTTSDGNLRGIVRIFEEGNETQTLTNINTQKMGTYIIEYVAKDKFGETVDEFGKGNKASLRRMVEVIYPYVKEVIVSEDVTSKEYKVGKEVNISVQAKFSTGITGFTSDSASYRWLINGRYVNTDNSNAFNYTFEEAGYYEITCQPINYDSNSEQSFASKKTFTIFVSKLSIFEEYSTIFLIVGGVLLLGVVVIIIIAKTRRNRFY